MGISTTEKKRIATHEKFQLFFKCVYIINKRIHGRLEFFAKLSITQPISLLHFV